MFLFFFFFSSRRRHTRCSRDWSSDVCSSDLRQRGPETLRAQGSDHLDPEVGEDLRGPRVRAIGDDVRPRFTRRHELHGRRPGNRRARYEGAVMTGKARGGLGRGLAALIPTGPDTTTVADVLINGAPQRRDHASLSLVPGAAA